MPIGRVTRQARHFQPQHDAGASDADLSNQSLKALAVGGRSARLAQIAVNHDDPIFGPAQRDCPLPQSILAFGAFAVVEHLAERGLADVEIGVAFEMSGLYFLMRLFGHELASWQRCKSIPARIPTSSARTP